MQLTISQNANRNYLAKIVRITNLRPHENADRLLVTRIDGCNVITAKGGVQVGDLVVYFPIECQISSVYLRANNMYRHTDKNVDPFKPGGFFEDTGRVRALKLRGEKSEGFIAPVSTLDTAFGLQGDYASYEDTEFDAINYVVFVKKYKIHIQDHTGIRKEKGAAKALLASKLIEGQFKFHNDTSKFAKEIHKFHPNDEITITWKMHGTSFVSSNLLTKKPLKWYEKALKWLGINIVDTQYDNIYSSRKVIKNESLRLSQSSFYRQDIWGTVNDLYKSKLMKGETIYGEIVGFTLSGEAIQSGFDYGCEDAPGKHFDVYIYRITYTNVDGKVVELNYQQMTERALELGVKVVPLLYSGRAEDLVSYKMDMGMREWRETLYAHIADRWVRDQDSIFCKNKVPEEGVVVRKEGWKPEAFKLKAFRFLERESKALDRGEISLEDQES